MIYHF